MSDPEREGRLGPALLVVLLAAALAAGIWVYHERTSDLALEVVSIERALGTSEQADLPVEVEWFVRFDESEADVEIVGAGDVTVRTFALGVALAAEERVRCLWDGIDDSGEPVEPGNYRLRVVLPGEDRDMVFPQRIKVRRDLTEAQVEGAERVDPLGVGAPCERENGEDLE